jgi:hypothetical protein
VWWCPYYVTAVYVNNWSWHVHGSHSVCLLKPGVTELPLRGGFSWQTKEGSNTQGMDGAFLRSSDAPPSLWKLHCLLDPSHLTYLQSQIPISPLPPFSLYSSLWVLLFIMFGYTLITCRSITIGSMWGWPRGAGEYKVAKGLDVIRCGPSLNFAWVPKIWVEA